MTFGEHVSELVEEVGALMLKWVVDEQGQPKYTDRGFAFAIHIFTCALMDRMWDLQEKEGIPMKQREEMAEQVGKEIRQLVRAYTGIDLHKFVKP